MPHPGRTILIVEHDEAVRDSLRALLESCGWCCRTFDSCDDLIASGQPDHALLLIDSEGLGPKCAKLLTTLRAMGSDMPAVAITPRDNAATRARLLAMGARAVLVRPFNLQELNSAIATATGEASADQLLEDRGASV